MSRIPPRLVNAYIFGGRISARNCLFASPARSAPIPSASRYRHLATTSVRRTVHDEAAITAPSAAAEPVPLRKQIKEEIQRRKSDKKTQPKPADRESLDDWELTVGIEVHAQLNTAAKLFSSSPSVSQAAPNTALSFFDLALPGSQPQFQPATLLPALRAALALGCEIQKESSWDRKHYFHWDQPSGYQITQYYSPFAKNGSITLFPHDGIAPQDYNDGAGVTVKIKQIQMEQDTAKTISQGGKHYLDFNRVGVPLIEIITGPEIHHPSTAAALVKKLQIALGSVDACVLGMEQGGLRADVNVSVRQRGTTGDAPEYNGVSGLGTRTEIKNLSSFKSIRDAIIVERDRQISVIESGSTVLGETRGFNIGDDKTTRLRGKEGEVDYRYMPDPDLPPLVISQDLIDYLSSFLGVLPDTELDSLTTSYNLSMKDALSLVALDDGLRVEYFYEVVDFLAYMERLSDGGKLDVSTVNARDNLDAADFEIEDLFASPGQVRESDVGNPKREASPEQKARWGPVAGNWALHELGGLAGRQIERQHDGWEESEISELPLFPEKQFLGRQQKEGDCVIPTEEMALIIWHLERKEITGATAKQLLVRLYEEKGFNGTEVEAEGLCVENMIRDEGLWYKSMTEEEYKNLAMATLEDRLWNDILGPNKKKAEGKTMYWVGKMMREGEGKCDAVEARRAIDRLVEEKKVEFESCDGENVE